MCVVSSMDRLSRASVVYFGEHGEVTAQAKEQGVSRQSLYRTADKVLRDLDSNPLLCRIKDLQQQLQDSQDYPSQPGQREGQR